MIIVTFGLPGVGKTYVGKYIAKQKGYFYFDGDNVLTKEMKKAIEHERFIDIPMRDRFFKGLIKKVDALQKLHKHIVVSQTFINEKYRLQFLDAFPKAIFLLIESDTKIREKRLLKRGDLSLKYVVHMVAAFDTPKIPHKIIKNDEDGNIQIKSQMSKLKSTTQN